MDSIKNSNKKTRTLKDLLVWCFALAVMAAIAVGGVEQGPTEANPSEDTAVADVGAEVDISANNKIQLINFKKDMGIRDALTLLALKFNKNIVPSPNVDGVLAFTTLKDVTFEEAMDAILGLDFQYETQDNFIKVYTAEEYDKIKQDQARMTFKVFTLYYISATEAKKLISPLLSKNSSIETTSAAPSEFPTGESISSVTGGGDTPAMNDTIIVYDFPENIAKVEDVLKDVDVRPTQVLIEATILSATLTEQMQFGIDWQTLRGAVTGLSDITRDSADFVSSLGTSKVTGTGGLTVGFAHDDVAGFIRALEEVTDITLLANPKVLAINKQLGQVYIGKKIGYRQGDTFDAQGNRVEGEVKFLDTGTKLSFRPYVGNDGYIRMDIHPKDSSGTLTGGIPNEDSAELVTNIMVKDGETIVIGGLFRDKITTAETKVPLLGDLPLVGVLFRGNADTVERQEVMVLLTPHIISEPNETNGPDRADDVGRKRSGAKESLQWIGSARIAENCYARAVKHYTEGDQEAALRELNLALELRPTYLEALRLKEKIVQETSGETIERTMLEDMDRQESDKWLRK